jgi:cation:H+ antiporter
MAVRLGVRPLLIGLTIVSYATSAPELAVSISAASRGDGGLVLGNVIGSNIANIGLILGVTALIAPPHSDGGMRGREVWVLLATTVAAPLVMMDSHMAHYEGALLVVGSVLFTWLTIRWSKQRPTDVDEVPTDESRTKGILIAIGIAGLCVLILGGEFFVRGAVGLAEQLGVSPRVIGLTVVAFGTSVPELAASVVAAVRGHSDLALGNVVGSNIFNVLLILGVSGVIDDFRVPFESMYLDMSFLAVLSVGAAIVLSRVRTISRFEGVLLTSSYVAFLIILVAQQGT